MFNKNLILLTFSQIFSFTAAPITVFLSGIIGASMIETKSLATLPVALMVVGTAFGSIFASYTMSKLGRKYGFMIGSLIISISALFASYSVFKNFFIIYCISNFLIGIGHAFASQYRFAAAENVKKDFIPNAISIILFGSMIGALIGPNIATITKDFIPLRIYSGSYIFLSLLTIIPFFFFLFYSDVKITREKTNKKFFKRSYIKLLFQPKFFQAVVSACVGYCIMSLLMTATPISMHIHNHISIGKTGFVIIFHIIAMFMPSLITGSLIKKFGQNNVMFLGVFVFFMSIFLNFVHQSFYNYFFGLIFLGIGWNFLFISGSTLLVSSYKSEEKFKAQGLNDFIVFTSQAIGALSAGFLLNNFGWKLINLFCIPLLLILVITILISNKKENLSKKI